MSKLVNYKIQALYPPESQQKQYPVLRGKMPAFGQREVSLKPKPTEESTTVTGEMSVNPEFFRTWTKDFTATLIETTPYQEPTTGRVVRLRMMLETKKTHPQSHRVIVTAPLDDIFFHWTFHCTVFSFKTLVKRMEWDFDQTAGNPFEEAFQRFGHTLKDLVHQIHMHPNRFQAILHVDTLNQVATLKMTETIQEYRKLHLLTLEFLPSDWQSIKRDVVKDYERIKKEYDVIKTHLVQVLDTVAKYQPALLLSKQLDMKPLASYQPRRVQELMDVLVPGRKTKSHSDRLIDQNKLLEELEDARQSIAILTKSIQVEFKDTTSVFKTLEFTFHALDSQVNPTAYQITITDPNDLFFHYTSIEITKERFQKLTQHMDLVYENKDMRMGISRATGLFRVPMKSKSAFDRLGFHHEDGVGGVVGVLGQDYMQGVADDPQRFRAVLEVTRRKESNLDPHLSDILDNSNKEPSMSLYFVEQVMFKTYQTIPIPFDPTSKDFLKLKMQHQYNEIKLQANACQERLQAVVAEVTKRNVGLLAMIDRLPVAVKQEIQYTEPDQQNRHNILMIPSRPVYEMKIPVQKDPKRKTMTTNERYQAQYLYSIRFRFNGQFDMNQFMRCLKNGPEESLMALTASPCFVPSQEYYYGQTLISLAAYFGKTNLVKLLLRDPTVNPKAGINGVFLWSAENGHLDIVKEVIKDPRFDPSEKHNCIINAAADKGQTEVVRLLLQDSRVDPSDGSASSLTNAASRGYYEICEMLLQDPRLDPARENALALRRACSNGRTLVVQLLLSDGRMDLHINDEECLRKACANGHLDTTRLLLEHDADPTALGNECIRKASKNGHYDIVRLLLQDPRVDPSAFENQALRLAAGKGHLTIVQLLMEDPRVNPADGENDALRRAEYFQDTAMISLLLRDARVRVRELE
ncbi:hypothetical protein EDD86DRAFT_256250 [Gorgonomyces haynaldii]|nr:hypothetical protein EDD86DRAFT_256250 [Gorgonomyces haynaldii]